MRFQFLESEAAALNSRLLPQDRNREFRQEDLLEGLIRVEWWQLEATSESALPASVMDPTPISTWEESLVLLSTTLKQPALGASLVGHPQSEDQT